MNELVPLDLADVDDAVSVVGHDADALGVGLHAGGRRGKGGTDKVLVLVRLDQNVPQVAVGNVLL